MGRTLVVVVADHKAASIGEHPIMAAQADLEVEALGLLSGRCHLCWFVEQPDRTIRVVVVVERRGISRVMIMDCRVAKVL
jgi:hypothetical protein